VGIPRKPAEEFHSSVAIMSAIVVPTATDLAYGMTFAVDQIIVAPEGSCRMPWLARGDSTLPMCETLVTGSQQELEGPIHAFHSVKSQCLSTGGRLGYAALPSSALTKSPCDRLKFDTMIPE